jgi:hypothetical protein
MLIVIRDPIPAEMVFLFAISNMIKPPNPPTD